VLLAGFSALTAFSFHNHFADQTQVDHVLEEHFDRGRLFCCS
jgi:hypothetical protein